MYPALQNRLAELRFPELKLLAPGPHALSPAVREVLASYRAEYTHRSAEFKACYARATDLLRELFHVPHTHTPLIFGHTGSYNWEMVAVNTPDDFKSLGLDVGSFSSRWCQVMTDRGRHIDVLRAEWGRGIAPDRLQEALAPGYDLALLIHNETSTGVALPVVSLCDTVREVNPGTLIGIDAVSVAGAVDVDIARMKPDYFLWSLQKDFAIPTIGSVMIVSDRAVQVAGKVPDRGYVLDLVEWMDRATNHQTPMTVADLTLRCLIARLEEMKNEGGERFERHRALTRLQREWAVRNGLSLLAEPGFESPSLSAIATPEGIAGPDLVQATARLLNVQLAPGYGSTGDTHIRIAAMGTTTEREMRDVLEGLSLLIDNWSHVNPELS